MDLKRMFLNIINNFGVPCNSPINVSFLVANY